MSTSSEPEREIEALRERIAALSAAILRISASLDVDTVLREIAEAARTLTGARYAVITTIDGDRRLEHTVLAGFTPEETRQVEAWTDNMQAFEALRDVQSPLRVADMPTFIASLGLSTDGVIIKTFQGAPMRHRGVQVGNFFLGEKETGPEFTADDEEVMVLFASQAATAIANARTHRDERRARADLEALVDTSPVAVVVFDARSGHPVSINREARRLAEGLRTAGRPAEELLQIATCRFSDGLEIALGELPLAQVLGSARTVRAEELQLSVPGWAQHYRARQRPLPSAPTAARSYRWSVTPCRIWRPLQELERLRAEFLGMVSHELRAPLAAIKGLGRHPAAGRRRAGPGRAARVLPHHRGAGRPHARADRRPARCGGPASRPAHSRSPPSPRRWPRWSTGRAARSCRPAAGIPCSSTCRRSCRG